MVRESLVDWVCSIPWIRLPTAAGCFTGVLYFTACAPKRERPPEEGYLRRPKAAPRFLHRWASESLNDDSDGDSSDGLRSQR